MTRSRTAPPTSPASSKLDVAGRVAVVTIAILLLRRAREDRHTGAVRGGAQVGVVDARRPDVLVRQLVDLEEIRPAVLARQIAQLELREDLGVVQERQRRRRQQ